MAIKSADQITIIDVTDAYSVMLTSEAYTFVGVCGSLGSIKWYKVGSDTAIATAKTLTVSANDVLNSQAYTCQLEG